jgi:hypothetical protein
MVQQPLVGQDLFVKASLSHSDTKHSVRLILTSDQPVYKPLSDNTQQSQEKHPCPRRDSNPQTHALDGMATGMSTQ